MWDVEVGLVEGWLLSLTDDDYDLIIADFADLTPDLAEAGIAWGAAKAHVVLARRRREGRR